jgi:hypothetical protein
MTGCATTIVEKEFVFETLPPQLLQKCEEIAKVQPKEMNLGDLVKYTTNLMGVYNDCAVRMDTVIKSSGKSIETK